METTKKEDQLLAGLLNALPDAVLFLQPFSALPGTSAFAISYLNATACRLLQTTPQAIVGTSIDATGVLSQATEAAILQHCHNVWQTTQPVESVVKINARPFTLHCNTWNDGILLTLRSHAPNAGIDHAAQQQQFLSILEDSGDGVMVLDAIRNEQGEVYDFRLSYVNNTGLRLARFTRDHVGKSLLEILPTIEASQEYQVHKKALYSDEPIRIETPFHMPDGEEYGWFLVTLTKHGDSVVSTFVDITEKKESQEKIEQQSQFLESILNTSINAMLACKAVRNEAGQIVDLTILKINKTFTTALGLAATSVEGGSYLSFFPASAVNGVFAWNASVIESGESRKDEMYYEGDGISGWYDVSAAKLGKDGILITFNNITLVKETQRAVAESAETLQQVLNNSQTGIALLDPVLNERLEVVDFRFKMANHVVLSLASANNQSVIGRLYTDLFAVNTPNTLFRQLLTIANDNQQSIRFEQYFDSLGTFGWLDVAVKRFNDGILVTFLDITPMKKLQQQILEASQKLIQVVNVAPAGMFTLLPILDDCGELTDFRFALANRTLAGYVGAAAEDMNGVPGSRYFPEYKTNGLFEIYKQTYLAHGSKEFDFHYVGKQERYFNIHVIRSADELLVTFTDHTSFKQLELELQASIEELRHTNANLEEFAYAASHDLQEPLRKIHYFSERLRRTMNEKMSDDENRMFVRMEHATQRMTQLINDLLVYSQMGRETGDFEEVDLNKMMHDVANDLETAITETNARLIAGELPTVMGNKLQLRQLHQNIIGNSLKYCKPGTPPVIRISSCKDDKVVNGAVKTFNCIRIADNGIGFDPQHASQIFKIFHRLHGQSEFPGTGIGLAIAQKVVENHKGFIVADGTAGEGAVFTIWLPA